MTEDEHFKRILVEDNFPATDDNTGYPLSVEERDSYLSIIKRFPFLINNGYELLQMILHKGEDLVFFSGTIGRNDGVVGTVDGRIDFVLEKVRMNISLNNGEKYDWLTAYYDELGDLGGKMIK